MKFAEIKARGKINISLNITGTSGGMHMLESVMSSIGIFDEVRLKFTSDSCVDVRFMADDGEMQIPSENSVTKAIRFLRSYSPRLGASVEIKKKIPMAGGLGGSSADAAAVIFAATEMLSEFADKEKIIRESVRVGSDVPFLVKGGCALVSGTGDEAVPINAQRLHIVTAHGSGGVASSKAYALFDELYPDKKYCPTDTDALIRALIRGDINAVAANSGNALQEPSRILDKSIDECLKAIADSDPAASFMTGSGNCCCGLYASESAASKAAERLRFAGLWAMYTPTCKVSNTM